MCGKSNTAIVCSILINGYGEYVIIPCQQYVCGVKHAWKCQNLNDFANIRNFKTSI